ncbi:hypothetical protein [Mesorhizobium sp.]|uniref:hypothetical protein n=1 Tax=Mesorhizobium sp. TaxID=1871066 RepID=UPI000FE774CE|nr:MAG: transporter substrate-binding domain-containing protein [Mesorhizobium sp.]
MGYTNIEPVVTDWGGLIPGLHAGGMYITGKRCANVSFASRWGSRGLFHREEGQPKAHSDLSRQERCYDGDGLRLCERQRGSQEGIAEDRVMQVPGLTEVLAAVKAGRADASAGNDFAMKEQVKSAPADIEVTDSAALQRGRLIGSPLRSGRMIKTSSRLTMTRRQSIWGLRRCRKCWKVSVNEGSAPRRHEDLLDLRK